jgi:group I intron endonuclease
MLIYKATNKTNGKTYIGQTRTSLNKRIDSHMREARAGKRSKSAFHNALLKYGSDNFDIQVIEECHTSEELNERERYWIAACNSICPNGYNIESGGQDAPLSESTKAKLRGQRRSEATRKLLSRINRNRPPEWNKNISEANRGKISNENQRRALELGWHRKRTDADKEKVRGKNNPRAILDEDQVREIRRLYALNSSKERRARKEYSQETLAGMFNVKQITISTIVTRKAWKHIN